MKKDIIKIECKTSGTLLLIHPLDVCDRNRILSLFRDSPRAFFLDKKQPILFDYLQKQKENFNKLSKMMPFFIKNSNKMAHFWSEFSKIPSVIHSLFVSFFLSVRSKLQEIEIILARLFYRKWPFLDCIIFTI